MTHLAHNEKMVFMKKFVFLLILLLFSNSVLAGTQWITKKNSTKSKVKTLEQMYVDGLLTRNECIKAKKKILKSKTITGCKKIETNQDSEVTYIAKKKKKKDKQVTKGTWGMPLCTHSSNVYFLSSDAPCSGSMHYIINKKHSLYEYYYSKLTETQIAKKESSTTTKKKVVEKKIEKYVPEETQEDNIKPNIKIDPTFTFKDPEYVLTGKVTDKGGSEKFYLHYKTPTSKKKLVKLENGKFKIERFSIEDETITLIATDEYRNETRKVVKVIIAMEDETEIAKIYDKPKPIIKGEKNNKRVAIIIGVESYENTPVKALYANNDAEMFKIFANRSLGINNSNIKAIIDTNAKKMDIVRTLKLWLPKKIIPNESELFVFFSGHGYPSENEGLHLIPQNGDPRLLEDSAISHNYIINLIKKTKPKSVTIFLDACYSGQGKDGEALIAGLKPLVLVANEEKAPLNFNIFSSSKSHQVSGTIKEAEHGMFSYYLMKGLEGKADENEDKKITNGELITYLKKNVSEEAFAQNREQDPTLSGNFDKVLMRY